ncbi:MAG TPA: cupin domain-containing protein [Baekduia sp.]|nr:cupin domain-containing protein [Baekduia sp.]
MDHPNVTHWDDVEAEDVAVGELRARWRDLGSAAGSFRAGVSLIEIAPGARSAPAHVHADEEEHHYVLDGDGLSWQDGKTYAISAGDCLLHRVHEETHTLIAGPDGLTVLAFGPRAESNITWLAHARVMRVGPHYLPPDVAPYEAEAAAGPLPVPATVERERPATVTAVQDVPPSEDHRGKVRQKSRRIGRMLGAETTGLRHVRIAPGAHGTPHHCHGAEEELFVMLGGAGEVRLGDERFPVTRGSVVARPPGTGVAHSFIAGEQGLELLTWGTNVPNDIAYYPDSGKVFLCGVGVIGRIEPCDYWDGED